MSPIHCEKCGSEDVTKVVYAYQSGVIHTTGTAVTVGAGISSDGLIPGAAVTQSSGTSISQATQRLAPPSAAQTWSIREVLGILFMVGGGFFLLAALVGPFMPDHQTYRSLADRIGTMVLGEIMLVGLGALALWVGNKLREWGEGPRLEREAQYQQALRTWQNSWVCHRCGAMTYIPPS